jgi:hypothetical protein
MKMNSMLVKISYLHVLEYKSYILVDEVKSRAY